MTTFNEEMYRIRKFIPGTRVYVKDGGYSGTVGTVLESWSEVPSRRESILFKPSAPPNSWLQTGAHHIEAFDSHVVCPSCRERLYPVLLEEKCCTHGCHKGARCVDCGAVKSDDRKPYWSCLGSL